MAKAFVIVVILAILIVLVLWLENWFRPIFPKIKWNIWKYFALSMSILTIMLLGVFVEQHSFPNNSTDQFYNTHAFNILTLVGIILTLIGLFLAYRQFKMSEDRIFGYDDLYMSIISLIEDKKRKHFQFWGPTLIPGLVIYDNEQNKREYRAAIASLAQQLNTELLISKEYLDENTYFEYLKKYTNGYQIVDTNMTWDSVKITEALKGFRCFKESLSSHIRVVDNSSWKGFNENYYISNGHSMIFVTSLHYEENNETKAQAHSSACKGKISTEVIGLKTSDAGIVKAYRSIFNTMHKTGKPVNSSDANNGEVS
jgi:hypothetical protein